ncbi:MAG: hypothetical protein AVDCRST_MAG38-1154, partial [uncultured Solirubrobacteraceae bacterium]
EQEDHPGSAPRPAARRRGRRIQVPVRQEGGGTPPQGRGNGLRPRQGVPRQPGRRPLRQAHRGARARSPRHLGRPRRGRRPRRGARAPRGLRADAAGGDRARPGHRHADRRPRPGPDRPASPRGAQEEAPQGDQEEHRCPCRRDPLHRRDRAM